MLDLEELQHVGDGGGVWRNVVDQRAAFRGRAAFEPRRWLGDGYGGDGGENEDSEKHGSSAGSH